MGALQWQRQFHRGQVKRRGGRKGTRAATETVRMFRLDHLFTLSSSWGRSWLHQTCNAQAGFVSLVWQHLWPTERQTGDDKWLD